MLVLHYAWPCLMLLCLYSYLLIKLRPRYIAMAIIIFHEHNGFMVVINDLRHSKKVFQISVNS